MGDEGPAFGAGDDLLATLGQSAASPEPCEGPLDDPVAVRNLEARGDVGAHDGPERPATDPRRCSAQLGPA